MYKLIDKVKELNPLVLHYTNNVTITALAIETISSTSSYEKLIKGLAPIAKVIFAQSVIVTLFV